jgi:uncharacterized protein
MTTKLAYKLNRFTLSVGIVQLILLAVIFNLAISWLFSQLPFSQPLAPDESIVNLANDVGLVVFFFLVVGLVPFLETVIFQALIIELVKEYLKRFRWNSNIFPIIVSAIAFSLIHIYSLIYVVITFFMGLCLAYTYIIVKKRKQNPILIVSIVHAFHNLIVFTIENI